MKHKQAFSDRQTALAAQAYLTRKCAAGDGFLETGGMTEQGLVKMISRFTFEDEVTLDIELRKFSQICMKNLTDKQWAKLRTAIRVSRSKKALKPVSIDVTPEAHLILKHITSMLGDDASLSEAIIELGRYHPKLNQRIQDQ